MFAHLLNDVTDYVTKKKEKNTERKLIIYIKKKVKSFCFQKEEKNPEIKLIIKYAPSKRITANESFNKTLLSATR